MHNSAGYNLIVTSELNMKDADIYSTYHNLWRIEESFKLMKSDLDARPAFVQKEDTIKGHFLICYLTVLLERLFQFKVLDERFSSSEIFGFIKGFKIVKSETRSINTTAYTDFIGSLSQACSLPLVVSGKGQVIVDGFLVEADTGFFSVPVREADIFAGDTTAYTDFIGSLSQACSLPLTNYFLSDTQIKSIMNYRFPKGSIWKE